MQLYSDNHVLFQNKLMEAKFLDKKTKHLFDDFLLLHFAYGIKADSPIELMRFKRFYAEDYGEECPWNDEDIKNLISEKCFFYDGKGYLLSKNKRSAILNEIYGLKENGIQIIYYRDLYEKNEEWFYNLGIYSDDMLKSFLQKYAEKIVCRKSYFSWSQNTENELLKNYILCIWGDAVLHDYSELKQCMEYVPIDKIKYALANNLCFVWNSAETYTCEDKFIISKNEISKILDYIKQNIELNDCVSLDEIPLETVIDENYELSKTAIITLIYNKFLSTDYVKNYRVISKKGKKRSAIELIEDYCKSKREILLEELFEQWELRTGTHRQAVPLDIAYSMMVRVDANRFVSDDKVKFDVYCIDEVLSALVLGDALGLKEITSFALFPDCGYSWNLFLIESFCRKYSKTFKYMAITTNSRNAGAIVRKKCDYDYHTLLAHILADSNIVLSDEIVMDYLYDKGYIARRSYKCLHELMELALELREGR